MKPNGTLLGIAALLVAMGATVAFKELTAAKEDGEGDEGDGGRAVPVQVAEVRSHEFADIVEAVGTVRAEESVEITARVGDTVTSIDFASGATVDEGDVLLTLADAEERAALAESEATLAEARRDLDRLAELSESNVVARSELDRSRSVVQRSQARLDAARARLDDHVIRAPFDGRVGLRDVSVGAYVQPGDVLLTLDQLASVDLDFTVPERFLATFEPGLPIRATATAYPDEAFAGTISGIDSRVNPVTRAVTVRARLPNPDGRLRPGMLLAVEIRRDEREAPAVPEITVLRDGELATVFGIEETGEGSRAISTAVKLGTRDGSLIEVLDGLATGDTIISEGMHSARDGGPVEIKGRLAEEGERESGDAAGTADGEGDS